MTSSSSVSTAAILLDRDGTIIEDLHYPRDPDAVRLIPGAAEALRLLIQKGYVLFVVSNQSGVGRGIISREQFESVHRRTVSLLEAERIAIRDYFYCLHAPDADCACRKPKTGMVPALPGGMRIDWSDSYVVGDRESDLMLGENLGASGLLVRTGYGSETEARLEASGRPRVDVFDDLLGAARHVPAVSSPKSRP